MVETKSNKQGPIFKIVWYANVILSIGSSYYVMNLIANDYLQPLLISSKRQAYAATSLFLLIHVILRQIVSKQEHPSMKHIHKCLDNIINNSILYFIILVCMAHQENYREIYSEKQVLQIVELFIWGRILFSIGYIFGTWAGAQSFRSYGFGLCVASLVSLFSTLLDKNFIQIFR